MVDRRKEEEYGTESKERRDRTYEVREKEELEFIKEQGLKNWILFKQPKNQAGYNRLKKEIRKKARKGAYLIQGFQPLLVKIDNAGTTIQRLMQLVKKQCQLVTYDIDASTKALASKDQRIADVVSYLESFGQTQKELIESKESAKKIKEDFKKAKKAKEDEQKSI